MMLGLPRTTQEREDAEYEDISEDGEDETELRIEGLVFQFCCKLSLSNSRQANGTDDSGPDRQLTD